jgi:hypothetical protein
MSKKSFATYLNDYQLAVRESKEEKEALTGMASTARSIKQCLTTADRASFYPKILRTALVKAVNQSRSITKIIEICRQSPSYSPLREELDEILKNKALEFGDHNDWEKIFCYSACGSKLEALARKKMRELD